MLSQQGEELIMRHEGFAPRPYICPAGKLTIGFGHVIRKGEKFTSITRTQAERLLEADVLKACAAVARNITVPLAQSQFDALVSFTFNLGSGRLQSSTLRQRLNRGDYEGAAAEFGRWVYGSGRKLPGLIARRADEKAMFLAGIETSEKSRYVILPWLKGGN